MVVGPKRRMLPTVRVLGPTRPETQVELAFTDGISLGIDLPVRLSGNIDGHAGLRAGRAQGRGGVEAGRDPRRAARPHGPRRRRPSTASPTATGCACGSTRTCSDVFDDLLVRVGKKIKLEVHLDTDEGNACDMDHAERRVEVCLR